MLGKINLAEVVLVCIWSGNKLLLPFGEQWPMVLTTQDSFLTSKELSDLESHTEESWSEDAL